MLNNCYKFKQKSSTQNELPQEEIFDNSMPMFTDHINEANKTIQRRELGYIIETALGSLPEDYRVVFAMREVNGLNVVETSELLKISEANVKTRLSLAKEMMRNEIQRHYETADIYEFNFIYCDAMVSRVMAIIEEL
jgi:RNA polymerase sigma factor (sigma-70 family)